MAKQEFLENVRVARNLFVHPRVSVDNKNLNPQELAKTLARSAVWLTPSSVRGFRPEDFAELGASRQKELDDAVHEFQSVAAQVPPASPATDAQYQAASAALGKLLPILDPYLPTRDESLEVRNALQNVDFSPPVVNWDFELRNDADGAPAVWVTVFIDEDEARVLGKQFGRLVSELTTKIRRAFVSPGIKRWPYVRLRTVAEHQAI